MATTSRKNSLTYLQRTADDKADTASSWRLSASPPRIKRDRDDTFIRTGYFSLDREIDQRATTFTIPDYASAEMEMVKQQIVEMFMALNETEELWAREDEDRLQVWLFTRSISSEREIEIYRMMKSVREQYVDIPIDLSVVHLGMFDPDHAYPEITIEVLRAVLPHDAEPLAQR